MSIEVSKVFLNLKVQDLLRSRSFFTELGFTIEEAFSNESAICLNINHHTKAMLLVEDHFKNFTSKRITDAHNETEVLISLGFDTRDEVYKLHSTAISLGAIEASHEQDLGFMLVKSFHDLDGHIWELAWINMSTIPNQLDQ